MWQDLTIKTETEAEVDVQPDDTVHVTWHEKDTSLTLIWTRDDVEKLMAKLAALLVTSALVVGVAPL